jgi:hypothetical protein
MGHEHGRRKRKIERKKREKSFTLKHTHFSVNNCMESRGNMYIDLRCGAVHVFSKSERLPEDGQVRSKHVAVDAILMLF